MWKPGPLHFAELLVRDSLNDTRVAHCTTLEGGTFRAEILVDLYLHENHFLADGSKVSEEKVPFLSRTKVLWRFATHFFFKGSYAKIALCKL